MFNQTCSCIRTLIQNTLIPSQNGNREEHSSLQGIMFSPAHVYLPRVLVKCGTTWRLQWATAIATYRHWFATYRHWFATYRHWFATYRHGFTTYRQLSQPTDTYCNLPTPTSTYRHLLQPTFDNYYKTCQRIWTFVIISLTLVTYFEYSSLIMDTRHQF